MTGVNIPDEAIQGAVSKIEDLLTMLGVDPNESSADNINGETTAETIARAALNGGAQLAFAAELQRLADELPGEWKRWSADYQAGRYDARQFFLNRAKQLRGES